MIIIHKYKNNYKVYIEKDIYGKSVNKDDSYILCKNLVKIYRFNLNTLTIQFNSNRYANNRLKELSAQNIHLKPFQIGDNEQTYFFSESDFNKVAEVVKAKKRIKRYLTDEQREVLRQRMKNIHSKKDS